jgi:UDP-N-acetyl-D-mannosaminuronic acid transferase (WecB/TagA/CpsF family)
LESSKEIFTSLLQEEDEEETKVFLLGNVPKEVP